MNELVVASPAGPLLLGCAQNALTRVSFCPGGVPTAVTAATPAVLRETALQLEEYFRGRRREFALPLAPEGTAFQQTVWHALAQIPYGETRSYGQLAAAIGRPAACRAVGGANHVTPIAIVIPCHRVIAADGSIGGYGGGIAVKRMLLALEGVTVAE